MRRVSKQPSSRRNAQAKNVSPAARHSPNKPSPSRPLTTPTRRDAGNDDNHRSVIENSEVKAAREAARKEHEFSSAVLDTTGALVLVLDREGHIERFNKACEQTTGYKSDEVHGIPFWDLFLVPEELDAVKDVFAEITAGRFPTSHEGHWLTKTGERRLIAWSNTALLDDRGSVEHVVATGIDITERRRAVEVLRETQPYLQSLLDYANAPIIVWDPSYRITLFNRAFEHLTGHDATDVLGQQLSILFPDSSRRESLGKIGLTSGGEHWESVDVPILCKNGETRVALWNSANIYEPDGLTLKATIAQGQDITERRLAEDTRAEALEQLDAANQELSARNAGAMREREKAEGLAEVLADERDLLQIVMENTPEANLVYLDPDFRFVMVNQTYADNCQMTKEELLGKDHFDLFPNEENEAIFTKVRDSGEAIEFKAKPFVYEYQPWRGVSYWDWTLTPVKDAKGNVSGLVFSLVDVTEDIRARQFSEALNEIDAAIHSSLDADRITETVVTAAVSVMNCESAVIGLWDGDAWTVAHVQGLEPSLVVKRQRFAPDRVPVAMKALKTKKPVALDAKHSRSAAMRHMVEHFGVKSILNVPLIAGGDVIGVIGFNYHSEALPFSERQIDFATKLAASVSLSLQNARLYAERREAARLNAALTEIDSLIHSTLDSDEIMRRIVVHAVKAVGCESARISLREGDRWVARYLHGEASELLNLPLTDEELPQAGLVATTKSPLTIADAYNDERVNRDFMRRHRLRSLIIVPLIVRNEGIGVFSLNYLSAPIAFTEAQTDFATKLGASVSLALNNADLYSREAEAARLNEALNHIGDLITSTFEEDEIMRRVVVEARKAVGCDSCRILLREDDGWLLRYIDGGSVESLGRRLDDSAVPHQVLAAQSGSPVVVDDTSNDPRVDAKVMQENNLKSLLIVPLVVRDRSFATLSFIHQTAPVGFTDAEVDFARKLSVSVSLALESAHLYTQEHRIAETLQRSLTQPVPKISGLEIGVAYTSAFEAAQVGGDFYDVFTVDDETVVAVVGDVSGKGIEAAGLTEAIRSSVRTLAYIDYSPAFVLSRLNQSLLRQLPEDMFATAHMLALNRKSGEIRISTAGQPEPVIAGKRCQLVKTPAGPPLGTTAYAHKESYLKLPSDHTFLLYTDGITEARGVRGMFGDKRLLGAVSKSRSKHPQHLVDDVLAAATRFADGKLTDDVALLALRHARER